MKNKEEIRLYLDAQLSASEDDMVQVVQSDFERILNSAATCTLIMIEETMTILAEKLHAELESLNVKTKHDVILKISYNPDSELSFDNLVLLLTIVRKFAPHVNIIWGCGTDTRLTARSLLILLLTGLSAE